MKLLERIILFLRSRKSKQRFEPLMAEDEAKTVMRQTARDAMLAKFSPAERAVIEEYGFAKRAYEAHQMTNVAGRDEVERAAMMVDLHQAKDRYYRANDAYLRMVHARHANGNPDWRN